MHGMAWGLQVLINACTARHSIASIAYVAPRRAALCSLRCVALRCAALRQVEFSLPTYGVVSSIRTMYDKLSPAQHRKLGTYPSLSLYLSPSLCSYLSISLFLSFALFRSLHLSSVEFRLHDGYPQSSFWISTPCFASIHPSIPASHHLALNT
ncbi:hypothetical protein LX32DRAFT_260996 [Colletotrichum zoysiae]|uniref:Uncharacterized protein n=1 Tax=Colletotrichum zoysiae TaxID=1216348 RepID=A0AAD9H4G3_9PEZI|nr:hypothetical protein LX32DRAFT_260996 [Colletotrichum zoysiae]